MLTLADKGGGEVLATKDITYKITKKTYWFFLNSSLHFNNFGYGLCFLFTKYDYS